jgi:hypothetical protein
MCQRISRAPRGEPSLPCSAMRNRMHDAQIGSPGGRVAGELLPFVLEPIGVLGEHGAAQANVGTPSDRRA